MDEAAWKLLVHEEREARQKLLDVGENGPKTNRQKLARNWFSSVTKVFEEMKKHSKSGSFTYAPPVELFAVFESMSNDLARGVIAQPILDVSSQGAQLRSRAEERDIGFATAYLQLVDSGQLDDSTPVRSVQEWYGVKRQTVYDWKNLALPIDQQWLLDDRDAVLNQIEQCGERYRYAGRTGDAAFERGGKKR